MLAPDPLPTDSVLRRHALTEHARLLGLPPTDAVLRRHYEHLVATPPARASAAITAAPAAPTRPAAPRVAPAPAPVRAVAAPVAAAPAAPAAGGGLFGWLRRLLGG